MKILAPFFLGLSLLAVHAASTGDSLLPGNGFEASHYESLWNKSPFAVASAVAPVESIAYGLVGIAQFDGIPYASLIDKQNNEHFLLAGDKPERGLTLVSVTHGADASGTSAVIKRNGETLTLKLEQQPVSGPGSPMFPPMGYMPGSQPAGLEPSLVIPPPLVNVRRSPITLPPRPPPPGLSPGRVYLPANLPTFPHYHPPPSH